MTWVCVFVIAFCTGAATVFFVLFRKERRLNLTMGRLARGRIANRALVNRMQDSWEDLRMVGYHRAPVANVWYADLTREDVEQIRAVIRDAGKVIGG